MDEYLGTMLSSDPEFFPLQRPTYLLGTQSTPNSPSNIKQPNKTNKSTTETKS